MRLKRSSRVTAKRSRFNAELKKRPRPLKKSKAVKALFKTPLVLKSRKKNKRLPRRLSGWIVAAVKDAQELQKKPGFMLNMSVYNTHYSAPDECHVCLAGAALVGEGLVPPGAGCGYQRDIVTLASTLNLVRTGDLLTAVQQYYGDRALPVKVDLALVALSKKVYAGYRRQDADGHGISGLAAWDVYLDLAKGMKALGL